MASKKYKLSFTAASLSIAASVKIAEIYLENKDWRLTKQKIREENILQSRTGSRSIRVTHELVQRLEQLNTKQLELLVEGNHNEQKCLLWLAVCKTYELVKEFAVEVLHEKYLSRTLSLTDLDYDAFFNRKADWNEELNQISVSTRKKIRQVMLLMTKEAGLVTDENQIARAALSNRVLEALKTDISINLQIFPVEPF